MLEWILRLSSLLGARNIPAKALGLVWDCGQSRFTTNSEQFRGMVLAKAQVAIALVTRELLHAN